MDWLTGGDLVENLLNPRTVWIVLWIGLGMLTVALLVLMRSRWGQARPISKCVVLSILAHIWLLGYAHMTKLWDEPAVGRSSQAVQVHVTVDDAAEPTSRETTHEQQLWQPTDELATATPAPHQMQRREIQPPPASHQPPSSDVEIRPFVSQPTTVAPHLIRPDESPSPAPLREPLAAQPIPAAQRLSEPPVVPLPTSVASSSGPAEQRRPVSSPGNGGHTSTQELAQPPDSRDDADALAAAVDQLNSTGQPGTHAPTATDSPFSPTMQPVAAHSIASAVNSNVVHHLLRNAGGLPIPEIYRARVADDRLRQAQRRGGDADTEAAVDRALAWLAANQSPDGRWDADRLGAGVESMTLGHNRNRAGADADTGITGLTLLAFLGAGHTHLEGPYRSNVQRGLEFLLANQRHDGFLSGNAQVYAAMYCHGMANLALGEAYALTGDRRIEPALRRAAQYSVTSQHPSTGGWRYLPQDSGDTSQFGWQVMALTSAERAGIGIPHECHSRMLRFLQSVSSGQHGGLAAYRAGEQPSHTMTAEALVCRMLLGADESDPKIHEAAEYLTTELPGPGQANLYYWYYGTMALYHLQDQRWDQWNASLKRALIPKQHTSGVLTGSWDPDTVWGGYGGRAYSTAMAALCLEVYYRFLPLYAAPRTAWVPGDHRTYSAPRHGPNPP